MRKLSVLFVTLSIILTNSYSGNQAFAEEAKKKKGQEEEGITKHPVRVPKFESLHLKNGLAYLNSRQYKKAYNEFFVAVRLNPSFWQGFKGIGDVFIGQGKITDGLNEYLKALKILNPTYATKTLDDGKVAMKEGDYQLAIKKFRKIFAINPAAGSLVNEGIDLIKDDKSSQAQKKFEEAIKVQASDEYFSKYGYADAHFKLANFLYEKKKYPEALKEYQKAVQFETEEFGYYYGLGNAAYKVATKNKNKPDRNMLKLAIENFERALTLNPREHETMFNLASAKVDTALLHSQDLELIAEKEDAKSLKDKKIMKDSVNRHALTAIKLLEIYTSVYPNDINARIYLGDAYTLAGGLPRRYLRAIEEYQTAINLDSGLSDLYFKQGISYYLASNIMPDSENLPITGENEKFYTKFGKKFYTGDMLTSAQTSFNYYLSSNLTGGGKYRKAVNDYLKTIDDRLANLGFRVPDKNKGY